ncbi:hypothetical protein OTU49_005760, partial [Cherax quadricarinatus]
VKNREEYHQRKTLARCMVSAGQCQPGYLSHVIPGGEPMLVVPQVRRAAGTQGLQHHSPRCITTRTRPTDSVVRVSAPTVFLPQEAHLKTQNEVVLQGFQNGAPSHFLTEKITVSGVDQTPGSLTSPMSVASSTARMVAPNQALRGIPLAPQYFMTPSVSMAPLMTPTVAAPQAMALSSGAYLLPSTPLTGYESLSPYALQAAFYQQALMPQPGIAALERSCYTTTGE